VTFNRHRFDLALLHNLGIGDETPSQGRPADDASPSGHTLGLSQSRRSCQVAKLSGVEMAGAVRDYITVQRDAVGEN